MTLQDQNRFQPDKKFASRLVHDFRALMRAVNTLPDWIIEDLSSLSDQVPNDVYRYLHDIQSKAERADHLILSVREFFDINSDTLHFEECDIVSTIKMAINQHKIPDGFTVTLNLVAQSCTLPQTSLMRVIGVLLDNSCRHHGKPAGNIHVTNIGTNGAVWVSDDGQGIPDKYVEKVFEPFVALQSQDVVAGCGFGLAIARKHAENWNGGLRKVENQKFTGTTIAISFP